MRRNERITFLTSWGTSSAKPSTSQMIPLENQRVRRTAAGENHHLTCFQRRRVRPKAPPPRQRKMTKPASMVRTKTMSAIVAAMTSSALKLLLGGSQLSCIGSHAEWIYGRDKSNGSEIIKTGHLPARYLSPITLIRDSRSFTGARGKNLL